MCTGYFIIDIKDYYLYYCRYKELQARYALKKKDRPQSGNETLQVIVAQKDKELKHCKEELKKCKDA